MQRISVLTEIERRQKMTWAEIVKQGYEQFIRHHEDLEYVVRCKDCVHRPKGTGANHDLEFPDYVCPCQCEDFWYSWMPKDDWFCASGERGEDAEVHK